MQFAWLRMRLAHVSRSAKTHTHTLTHTETVTHALFNSAETEISFPSLLLASLGVSFTPINRSDSCAKGESPRQPQRLATHSLRLLSLTAAHRGRRLLRRLGGKKLDPLDRLFWARSQVKMPWAKFSFGDGRHMYKYCTSTGHVGHRTLQFTQLHGRQRRN